MRRVEQRDDNVNSQADYRSDFTFAPNGNTLTEFEEWDRDHDGVFEVYRSQTYDDQNNFREELRVSRSYGKWLSR